MRRIIPILFALLLLGRPAAAQFKTDPDGTLQVDVTKGGAGGMGTVATPNVAGGNATATPPSGQSGVVPLSLDANANLRVTLGSTTVSLGAGTASIGNVGLLAGSALVGAVNLDIAGVGLAFGQANAANSLPVVLASNQTLPLPAGAATAALQASLNGDGGSQVHVQNFPATQTTTPAPVASTPFSVSIPATSAVQVIPCSTCNALPSSGSTIPTMVTSAEIQSCTGAVSFASGAAGFAATSGYPSLPASWGYKFNPPIPATQVVSLYNAASTAVTCTGFVQ